MSELPACLSCHRPTVLAALLLLPVAAVTSNGPIVNEALVNEPGSQVALEWIELLNTGPQLSLAGYVLSTGVDDIDLPDSLLLASGEYFIVCRKLHGDSSSPGFENWWGNNSGVWGDDPWEATVQTPLQASFGLANNQGSVQLIDPTGRPVSELSWNEPGADGVSWERVLPASDSVGRSLDPTGSTPGRLNSTTPVAFDLALETVTVTPAAGQTTLEFLVVNRGTQQSPPGYLILYEQGLPDEPIDSLNSGTLFPGDSIVLHEVYFFPTIYVSLSAQLPDDGRPSNNSIDFIAPGTDFPPLILTEVLPDPAAPLASEWVELWNSANQAINLLGWQLGDALSLHGLTEDTLLVGPAEYVIIARDTLAFFSFYGSIVDHVLQPAHWPPFNNDKDVVRLIDPNGFEADDFSYTHTFGNNFTWSRADEPEQPGSWGRSEQPGGTPGQANVVLFEPEGSVLTVSVRPNPFSPDDDGFEDEATITVDAPAGAVVNMEVYDRQGRLVRTLLDGATVLRSVYTWDGRTGGGRRLPIGIYILYVEAEGVESRKVAMVIAR